MFASSLVKKKGIFFAAICDTIGKRSVVLEGGIILFLA
jgi:hypothetical protein